MYQWFSPPAAVATFFTISGYLILGGLASRPGLKAYAQKRLLRIYPAYFIVVIAAGLAFAPTSAEFFRYESWNLIFLNFVEPGFASLPNGGAVNGSLWSIKVEVAFYVIAPLLAIGCRRFSPALLLGPLAICSAVFGIFSMSYSASLVHQLPAQLCYFCMGGLLFHYGKQLSRFKYPMIAAGLATLPLGPFLDLFGVAAIVLAVMSIRWVPSMPIDLSYEIYLAHYPVIQALTVAGLAGSALFTFGTSVVAAIGLISSIAASFWLAKYARRRAGGSFRRAAINALRSTRVDGQLMNPAARIAPSRASTRSIVDCASA
jgi:peptidoglycan/LPS O-acetylase OafA/YrhL